MSVDAIWSFSGSEWAERWMRPSTLSLDGLADEELAAKAQAGSSDHFSQLVRRHTAGVYRVGYLLTGNRQEAEDIAQETFIKVYQAISRYRPGLPFKPWLYRIAINTSRSAGRKKKSRPETTGLNENEASLTDAAESVSAELDALGVVKMLPPDYRPVVILRAVEGLSFSEISGILEMPEPTARTKFHRAKALLKARLAAIPDASTQR